jgi:glycosyltransferase involved in cell wall biosynthesis
VRLGVYSDDVYRLERGTLTSDRAFIWFVTQLAHRLGEVVLLGRLDPRGGRSPYELPSEGVRFVALPWYERTSDLRGLAGSVRGSRRAFAAELARVDAVWLFGPHPLALEFARIARRARVPVFLGVRQDFPGYIAGRLGTWAVPAAHALERAWRLLARRHPTVAVGEPLGRAYAEGRAPVLVTGFSLVGTAELTPVEEALARDWSGELRLLSVGRLDPEKNPLLLPEILARLRGRWRLAVVGTGPLAGVVEARARELGVANRLELLGYLPHGPKLRREYRRSHAFLHVSLTEGLPQVLVEAHSSGLPVVATAVGGVAAALQGGELGLLVPPRNAEAVARALGRLAVDAALRERLVRAGLEHASQETLEANLDRLAAFFRQGGA